MGDVDALRAVSSMEASPWVRFGLRVRGAEGVCFGWLRSSSGWGLAGGALIFSWVVFPGGVCGSVWRYGVFDLAEGGRVPLPGGCRASLTGGLPVLLYSGRHACLIAPLSSRWPAAPSSATAPGGFPAALWCPRSSVMWSIWRALFVKVVLLWGCFGSRVQHLSCSRVSVPHVRRFGAF